MLDQFTTMSLHRHKAYGIETKQQIRLKEQIFYDLHGSDATRNFFLILIIIGKIGGLMGIQKRSMRQRVSRVYRFKRDIMSS